MTIHQKLDYIMNNAGGSNAYFGLVSKSRTFNISAIVGSENLSKYSESDFVIVGGFSDSPSYSHSKYDGGTQLTSYANVTKNSEFILNYNKTNGDVTITGGNVTVTSGIANYQKPMKIYGSQTFDVAINVYMIIKTPDANIPTL